MKYTKITRELLESMKFRPFETEDFYGFAGVESPVPMISENEDEGITVVIDGDVAELYAFDGCADFELIDTCENIRMLDYKSEKQLRIEAEIKKMEDALVELRAELVKA